LIRPEPYRIFPRERLFRLLDEARRHPLIWIAGPGGSGKTSLASSYLQQRGLDSLWYQLDEREDDPASLFHHLSLAAQWLAPAQPPLPPLTPDYLAGLGSYSRRFFEQLYQRLPPKSALVLDDYHTVAPSAVLHELVRDAAPLAPPDVSLIVLSRTRPPPAYARLQTHGQLRVLGWDDLQITAEEAHGLAGTQPGQDHQEDWIEHCRRRTDGWAAGFMLMLRQQATAPNAGPGQTLLFDYIAGEFFQGLTDSTRHLLLQLVVLPKLDIDTVQRYAGTGDAATTLAELHRDNPLIARKSGTVDGYDFHPLFRDFLYAQSLAEFGEDERRAQSLRAAEALIAFGHPEDAVPLLIATQSWKSLIGVIHGLAPSLLTTGRHRTLLQWFEAIPEDCLTENGWALNWLGNARMPSDQQAARAALERAYEVFDRQDDAAGLYLTWCAIIESSLAEFADTSTQKRWLPRFRQIHERHPQIPSVDIDMRVHCNLLLHVYSHPNQSELPQWAEHAMRLLQSHPDAAPSAMLGTALLNYCLWRGEIGQAAVVYRHVELYLLNPALPPMASMQLHTLCADFHFMFGNARRCLELVDWALTLAAANSLLAFTSAIAAQGVYGALCMGDESLAARYLETVRTTVHPEYPMEEFHYDFLHGSVKSINGEVQDAIALFTRAIEWARSADIPFAQALTLTGLAFAQFMDHDPIRGNEALAEARRLAEAGRFAVILYESLMKEALAHLLHDQSDLALPPLRQALTLSREKGGLVLGYAGPQNMARLYAAALEAGIEVPYVQSLIRRLELMPPAGVPAPEHWPYPLKIYTLGRFSLVVDGQPLDLAGKTQRKPLELLMALIALDVPQSRLTDILWPDADGDAAYRALVTNLKRLREMLGQPEAIELKGTAVSLDARRVWVDAWAFERWLSGTIGTRGECCCKAIEMYHGPFLADVSAPWAIGRRERLAAKYRHHVLTHGHQLEAAGQSDAAIARYLRALEADENDLAIHDALIRCYRSLGRESEAQAAAARSRRIG
jgi:ATP/maltotriose-dependent transcriptional regulator MalT/DNA-binding SARP family transcriptional activator